MAHGARAVGHDGTRRGHAPASTARTGLLRAGARRRHAGGAADALVVSTGHPRPGLVTGVGVFWVAMALLGGSATGCATGREPAARRHQPRHRRSTWRASASESPPRASRPRGALRAARRRAPSRRPFLPHGRTTNAIRAARGCPSWRNDEDGGRRDGVGVGDVFGRGGASTTGSGLRRPAEPRSACSRARSAGDQ